MSDTDAQVPLPDLNAADVPATDDVAYNEDEQASRIAADLEAVFDVPVQVSNSTAASAKPSTSTSTTAWWRAARWCWWKTSLA